MKQLFQKLWSTRKRNLSASSLLVKSKKLFPSKGATEFRKKLPGDTCQLFLPSGCSSSALISPSRKTKHLRTLIKANLENSVSPSVPAWKAFCHWLQVSRCQPFELKAARGSSHQTLTYDQHTEKTFLCLPLQSCSAQISFSFGGGSCCCSFCLF